VGTSIVFSRLTQLHAYGRLDPITNKGSSSTEAHMAAEGVKLLALAMAGVEVNSPGWIEFVETYSLVDRNGLYPIPEGYEERFPQMRFGMRIPAQPLGGYEILNEGRFGWSNYGLRAIVIEVTELGDNQIRVVLHTLMKPCAAGCIYMTSVTLDGSISSWRFTGSQSTEAIVEAFIGNDEDVAQRQAIMENALPITEFPTKSQFVADLVLMAQMVASYEKIPAGRTANA
jgi:hypothetical protein